MRTIISFQKILLAFFAFIGLMIVVRFIYSGEYRFIFFNMEFVFSMDTICNKYSV